MNIKTLTDEQRDLASFYWPIAEGVSREFPGDESDRHDAAVAVLLRVVTGPDPEARCNRAYFATAINHILMDMIRHHRRWRSRLDMTFDMASEDFEGCRIDDSEEYESFLSFLSPRERLVVDLWCRGMNFREMRPIVGCGKSGAIRIKKNALNKIINSIIH